MNSVQCQYESPSYLYIGLLFSSSCSLHLYQNKTVLYIVGRTADTIDAAADVSGKKDLSALIGGRMATESSTPSVAICTIKVPPSIIPKCKDLLILLYLVML